MSFLSSNQIIEVFGSGKGCEGVGGNRKDNIDLVVEGELIPSYAVVWERQQRELNWVRAGDAS